MPHPDIEEFPPFPNNDDPNFLHKADSLISSIDTIAQEVGAIGTYFDDDGGSVSEMDTGEYYVGPGNEMVLQAGVNQNDVNDYTLICDVDPRLSDGYAVPVHIIVEIYCSRGFMSREFAYSIKYFETPVLLSSSGGAVESENTTGGSYSINAYVSFTDAVGIEVLHDDPGAVDDFFYYDVRVVTSSPDSVRFSMRNDLGGSQGGIVFEYEEAAIIDDPIPTFEASKHLVTPSPTRNSALFDTEFKTFLRSFSNAREHLLEVADYRDAIRTEYLIKNKWENCKLKVAPDGSCGVSVLKTLEVDGEASFITISPTQSSTPSTESQDVVICDYVCAYHEEAPGGSSGVFRGRGTMSSLSSAHFQYLIAGTKLVDTTFGDQEFTRVIDQTVLHSGMLFHIERLPGGTGPLRVHLSVKYYATNPEDTRVYCFPGFGASYAPQDIEEVL